MVDCTRLSKHERLVRDQAKRALARCHDLYSYRVNDMGSLTHYGQRYRQGLPISASRAEGCVDDIGNVRMGKRRRMRWPSLEPPYSMGVCQSQTPPLQLEAPKFFSLPHNRGKGRVPFVD